MVALAAPAAEERELDVTPEQLIVHLADERFVIRQQAEKELHRRLHLVTGGQNNPIEELCLKTYLTTPDPEVRMRTRAVLADFAARLWGPVAYLGVATSTDTGFDPQGKMAVRLRVNQVQADSPAAKAGIKTGDLIVSFNGGAFTDPNPKKSFTDHLAGCSPGQTITVSLQQGGRSRSVTVSLGYKPRKLNKDAKDREIPPDFEACFKEYLLASKRACRG